MVLGRGVWWGRLSGECWAQVGGEMVCEIFWFTGACVLVFWSEVYFVLFVSGNGSVRSKGSVFWILWHGRVEMQIV